MRWEDDGDAIEIEHSGYVEIRQKMKVFFEEHDGNDLYWMLDQVIGERFDEVNAFSKAANTKYHAQ